MAVIFAQLWTLFPRLWSENADAERTGPGKLETGVVPSLTFIIIIITNIIGCRWFPRHTFQLNQLVDEEYGQYFGCRSGLM